MKALILFTTLAISLNIFASDPSYKMSNLIKNVWCIEKIIKQKRGDQDAVYFAERNLRNIEYVISTNENNLRGNLQSCRDFKKKNKKNKDFKLDIENSPYQSYFASILKL